MSIVHWIIWTMEATGRGGNLALGGVDTCGRCRLLRLVKIHLVTIYPNQYKRKPSQVGFLHSTATVPNDARVTRVTLVLLWPLLLLLQGGLVGQVAGKAWRRTWRKSSVEIRNEECLATILRLPAAKSCHWCACCSHCLTASEYAAAVITACSSAAAAAISGLDELQIRRWSS